MARATRTTAWVKGESGVERRVRWTAGYDCRVRCPHDPPGNHGQHGDELSLDVRSWDAALSLELSTWARDGKDNQTGMSNPIEPAYLHAHFGFVWLEEQVRAADGGRPCDVLKQGKCLSPEGRTTLARELWEAKTDGMSYVYVEIEREIASPIIEQLLLASVPAVWLALETTLIQERGLRWKEHEALPRQCDKCHGTGVVPRCS